MASRSILKASSSTSNPHSYDVFLSFRGKDTRKTFTGHLYANLVAHGIHTFRDDEELEKGGDIASDLSRAIEESKIFIIIFSENYADSKWCLNELVKIIDCKTKKASVVLPVFYHVDPRDVGSQGGSFENAFVGHAKDADQEKKKTIETWKNALKTAAKLSGYHLHNQSEVEFIQRIREDLITRLNRKPLHVGDNIVGMDFHLKQLKSLIEIELDEVHMVGIYGIGGIGKTTISKAIYNDISSQFDGSCFLGNVGGKGEDGLLKLQKTLLQDILKCERPKFNNISEGINAIKDRLHSKRVLIVLDDVDNYMQLENLVGKHGWYGAQSIIIITTRDKHLLERYEVNAIYEVQKLNNENSIELFNWWAFKQNTPIPKFKSLSDNVVKYADGLPIALKVLGGFLFKKSIDEWKSELHKLQKIPDRTVQSVLKVSYDKLDLMEQGIFLDIACFFRGEDKDSVSRILGSYAEIGIKVLHDRCLITILEKKLYMHDLLHQMSQEIIRQEYPQEPGKRSRLWDPIDVNGVLTSNMGTEAIEGLSIEISKSSQIRFTTKAFERMNRLRLLKVYNWCHKNVVQLPMDLEFPSSELRYLRFEGYSLESLPTNFCGKNLVELDLLYSGIKQLWKGNKILNNLKVINLSYSKDLVEIPDYLSVPNLEILILTGCTSLESLPRNFHKFKHLRSFSCYNCSKLKSFPEIKGNMSKLREIDLGETAIVEVPSSINYLNGLEDFNLSHCKNLVNLWESTCKLSSLETLNVWGCSNLESFPGIKNGMENLVKLDLSCTAIEKLPYSIGHMKALKLLDLSRCENLVRLSKNICNLSSLESLNVWGCSNLKGFPEIKDDMKNLVRLDLSKTALEELPYSIGHLKVLKFLNLSNCENLVSLPKSICNLSSLETLNMLGCSNLKGFPGIKDDMENLVKLDLSFTAIEELPHSIGCLKALKLLHLSNCKNLVSLPESICNLSSLETLNVLGCSKLKGFPEIRKDMKGLINLYLGYSAIKELPYSIAHLKALKLLDLSNCENLVSLPESICSLSSLEMLEVQGCSNLKGFPEIRDDMENLGKLDLSKTGIEELPYSIGHLKALKLLNLSNCQNLMSLPDSICNLSSLETLNVWGCSNLKSFPEIKDDMENLVELDLSYTYIEELPYSIEHLKALKHLDLSNCKNLVRLPESICNLSSLETVRVTDCPNLERLEMNLEGSLYVTCCILTQGVMWSNYGFTSLKTLNTQCNQMEAEALNHCIFPLSSIRNSRGMERGILSESFPLSSLQASSIGNFNPMARGILSDIFYQSSLERLSLHNFNLMEEGILTNIWNLSSLVNLSLSNCNITEGDILNHICHLSLLEELSLDGNHFSSIPAGIGRLSNLKGLNLSHCKKLQDIPELPSSLLFLDVHCSDGISSSPSLLSNHSLFNHFKSELTQETRISVGASKFNGKGMSIVIPRSSGILKGIRNQSMGSDEVTIELPQNWYQNNDLLGFAFCCVYVPVLDEFNNGSLNFYCELTVWRNYQSKGMDNLSFNSWRCCDEHSDDSISDQVWLIYYPKDAIEEQYHSNQWTHLMASFNGNRTLEAEACWIHLIYADCLKCQQNEECQQKLCLKGKAINELPFIVCPFELGSLCLRECKNLESLPSTICELKSLTILSCSGCSRLKSFPEMRETLENLREVCLDGTAIEELPSSIQRLRGLRYLNLAYCNNLMSLPETICHLKSLVFLSCLGCSQLKNFPEILENMENLRELHLDGTAIKELPSSIEHLLGLQDLSLSNCSNLVSLPKSICNLRFLKYLNVNLCSKLEKFPQNLGSLQCLEFLGAAGFDLDNVQEAIWSDVCYMSLWEASNLTMNYFSSILVSIIQLSKLRVLDLSHCQKLLQIPELPPSLRILDVHACPCLGTLSSPSIVHGFSLFKCFKSAIEEFECGSNGSLGITIVIPGKGGIPEWVSQQKKGSQITIELPVDWYQNNDFLGFALYSVYVPLHIESKEYPCSLKCELNFHGHRYEFLDDLPSKFWPVGELSFICWYSCCHNGGQSNRAWVAYYPKVAIKNEYWSNEWRHLEASFHGFFDGKPVKVEECGFHLIYMPKVVNRTIPQDAQFLDLQRSCGTKPVLEDALVNGQRSCDDEQSTDHDHSPTDTITQNIDDNAVDAQGDEEDHMHKWLELLCKFIQWVCSRSC